MVNNIAEEIVKMKKIVALILAAILLCSCTLALAEIPPCLSATASLP